MDDFLMFPGIKIVNLGEGCLLIPYVTYSAFQHLLIHMFSVTTSIVMAV
jgi:hypothetical protein